MNGPRTDLPPKASREPLAEWNDLADRVCREPAPAALPFTEVSSTVAR
ncbi:hypothetical protein GCM10010275_19880 [Streptomyces litmocidini]|nr:hypothetical protein [Streptomyces litmocidini]GGU84801.1 hypothetical protein GCM10010275_19880 [Streptomyces litmocidini]